MSGPAYDDLRRIEVDCRAANWDGDGAEPVAEETLRFARQVIDAIPDGSPVPDVSAEPDGQICLEWYRATNRLLSVSVSPERVFYFASLVEGDDAKGTCRFDGEIPDAILYWIRRVCADDRPEPNSGGTR